MFYIYTDCNIHRCELKWSSLGGDQITEYPKIQRVYGSFSFVGVQCKTPNTVTFGTVIFWP